ncbi:hypothetical protein N7468_006505 [Penicillium chermesinum]|uniref:Uncharacterized protein n=1 Tax=Penicillium chermesinum TaxID=63820 RepID=A0A9W9NSF9_9EURO|nr:uncharacterized protein N7468_006505 [Penicillium chermesinum]KAJ5225280.1 hypothetical protein N7468_006505 [Penicillium chermesinum]
MPLHPPILHLADELLAEILAFVLERRSGRNGHADRDYPIEYGENSDLDRFRLVCKRFMHIATPRKFSRVNVRFSKKGLRRLEELVAMQRACYVKTLTYLVRPFWKGSGWTSILLALRDVDPALAQFHHQRLEEENSILNANYDLMLLRRGIAAFSGLQEIKLFRTQDEADESLLDFQRYQYIRTVRNNTDAESSSIQLDWDSACSRAVKNLGIALLDSQCSSIRFTGPQISPEATLQLLQAPSAILADMAGRLTSLDINFHSHSDISPKMADLSSVFHRFFLAAKNLMAIHIGFPPKSPLNLDLESIFHNIRWKTLRMLSLQGWRLDAEEINALLRRHREHLRDFRLFAIYLRPGSRWTDVLTVLRYEMEQLDRLDLRDIDYDGGFDIHENASGVEVSDYEDDASHPEVELSADGVDAPDPVAPASSSLSVAAGTSPPELPPFSGFGTDAGGLVASATRAWKEDTSATRVVGEDAYVGAR